MANMTTITLSNEVYFDEAIIKLRGQRKLSSLIDRLLREYFDVIKEALPDGEAELDGELMQTQVKMARLKEKKAEIKKAVDDEMKHYRRLD